MKTIQFESGRDQKIALAVSQTIAKGDGLVWSSGYLTAAADTEEILDYVAIEAVTTDGSAHTEILVYPASQSRIRYEVDTTANTAVAQRGVAYQMKTVNTLDNATGAGANGFLVDEIVGGASNKKVRGYFL